MAKANTETALQVVGINKLLRVLNRLPKDLQKELRDASQGIADDLASKASARASTPLQRMVAGGVVSKRDRVPVVTTRGTVGDGIRTRDVFYGAEFGGGRRPTTRQFEPHLGRTGYFLYPTARARSREYFGMWVDAVDKAFKDWDDDSARHGTS